MVIHSTTLDTMAKVIAQYGGTTWIRHDGYMLRGASSNVTANQAQSDAGADSVSYTPAGTNAGIKLTAAQSGIPAHAHGLNSHKHSVGAHSHGLNSHKHTYNKVNSATEGHAITVSQMPSHNHTVSTEAMGGADVYGWTVGNPRRYGASYTQAINTGSTGSGSKHSHDIKTTSTNSGAASGSTANSTAFDTGAASGNTANNTAVTAAESHTHTFTGTAATISTLPKYKNVYIWERTA